MLNSVISQAAQWNIPHPPLVVTSLVPLLLVVMGLEGSSVVVVVSSGKHSSISLPSLGPEMQPSQTSRESQCFSSRQSEGSSWLSSLYQVNHSHSDPARHWI